MDGPRSSLTEREAVATRLLQAHKPERFTYLGVCVLFSSLLAFAIVRSLGLVVRVVP